MSAQVCAHSLYLFPHLNTVKDTIRSQYAVSIFALEDSQEIHEN